MSEPAIKSVPRHVAIIMDGNGRWAQERGWPRIKGHEEGARSVRAALRACRDAGVEYLTLYAFSVENWKRPAAEIKGLMLLLRRYLDHNLHELHEHQVRLRAIGRLDDLPGEVRKVLDHACEATRHHARATLTLALSYGGRAEITDAARAIARKARDGLLDPETIEESTVAEHLYAPDIPDPDLLIRTSGELRISNFLLWQLSYAELYVTPVCWPDFREPQLAEALEAYRNRHRRFGQIA